MLEHDRCMVGERLSEFDLLEREAPDLVATRHQRAEDPGVREQRDRKRRPIPLTFDEGTTRRRQVDGRVVHDVRGPDRTALRHRRHGHAVATIAGLELTEWADQPAGRSDADVLVGDNQDYEALPSPEKRTRPIDDEV